MKLEILKDHRPLDNQTFYWVVVDGKKGHCTMSEESAMTTINLIKSGLTATEEVIHSEEI